MKKNKTSPVVKSSPSVDIDKQLADAMRLPEVRKAYQEFKGDPEKFMEGLKSYIQAENGYDNNLRKLAGYLDTGDRALVPLDTTLDAAVIFGGLGTAAKGILTLAKLPIYMTYDAYYFGKTGDLVGTLGNAIYEAGSWFIPGSLPHLIGRYAKQAEKHATKKGSERFVKKIKQGGLEDKVLEFPEQDDSVEEAIAA